MYDVEDDIEDVAEQPVVNPFRTTWYGQAFGSVFWLLDATRFWIGRPFVLASRRIGRILGYGMWHVEGWIGHLRGHLQRGWWFVLDFLRVDGFRNQVHSLQEQAAQSLDDLTHTVQERTIHSGWFRSLGTRLESRRIALQMRWIAFLEWTEQSAVTRLLAVPVRWVAWLAFAVSDFCQEWLWTREFRHLLYGIPAIVLLMPLVYCAARMPFYSNHLKSKHYLLAVQTAMEEEDFAAADLYFRKLGQLGDVRDRVTFQSALLAEQQGDVDKAYSLMKSIANEDSTGMFDAYIWIAQHVDNGQVEKENPDAHAILERNLKCAIAQRGSEPQIRIWLAQLYAQRSELELVREVLTDLPTERLTSFQQMQVAGLHERCGERASAARLARGVIAHYENVKKSAPEPLSSLDASTWSAAYELLGEYASAVDIAATAVLLHPDDSELRARAMTLAENSLRSISTKTITGARDQWRVLTRMLEISPDRTAVLLGIVQLKTKAMFTKDVDRLVAAEIAAGTLPGLVSRALGDLAIVGGDRIAAREWYSRAVETDPTLDAAVNNLAYLMAHSDPIDLEKALELANQAVAMDPDNSHYRETRGQILILQEQWPLAIDDLARAVNGMPNNWQIHESLAAAYAHTGNEGLARVHAEQCELLRKR